MAPNHKEVPLLGRLVPRGARRRRLIALMAAAVAAAASVPCEGQQVALIISRDIPPYQAAASGFADTFRNGFDQYQLGGDTGKGQSVLDGIRKKDNALVVAVGSEALELALSQKDKPVLFTMVLAPKRGRGLAGVALEVPLAAQLAVLREALPKARSVGLIYHASLGQSLFSEASSACQQQGIELVAAPVGSDHEVSAAAKAMAGRIDALLMVSDPVNISASGSEAILTFGLENRIPIMAPSEKFVKAGALLGMAADYREMGAQAARMANAVLSGEPVFSQSFERPRRHTIIINLKVAKEIGLTVPPALVKRAGVLFR